MQIPAQIDVDALRAVTGGATGASDLKRMTAVAEELGQPKPIPIAINDTEGYAAQLAAKMFARLRAESGH